MIRKIIGTFQKYIERLKNNNLGDEDCFEVDEKDILSTQEANNILNNLYSKKFNLEPVSLNWLTGAANHDSLQKNLTRRSSVSKNHEDISYFNIDRFFSDIETSIIFEKNQNSTFNMDINAKIDNNIVENTQFKLERANGAGYISRPFVEGIAFVEKIPFNCYRMSIIQNGIPKGDFYFSINEEGFDEK